jgi:hypothetical protein
MAAWNRVERLPASAPEHELLPGDRRPADEINHLGAGAAGGCPGGLFP